MADYYCLISFKMKMTDAQFDWAARLLDRLVSQVDYSGRRQRRKYAYDIDEAFKILKSEYEDFGINLFADTPDPESDGLDVYFIGEEYANVDFVASFVQQIMLKFNLIEPVGFQYCRSCSKPRSDAYGGGAVVVTQTEVMLMDSQGWMEEQIEELKSKKAEV